jgi:hypothetical protein
MILEASCCGCKIWSLAYALAHMLKLLWREPTICCQIYITHHSTHHIEWFLMFWGPYYDSHKKVEWREPAVGETLNFNHFL